MFFSGPPDLFSKLQNIPKQKLLLYCSHYNAVGYVSLYLRVKIFIFKAISAPVTSSYTLLNVSGVIKSTRTSRYLSCIVQPSWLRAKMDAP